MLSPIVSNEPLNTTASIATDAELTMVGWPIYCGNTGVTSFDHASHHEAWSACLACRKMWMAKIVE